MSATGEAPFFNAPEPTQRDGTLSQTPGEMFADPVSGLVTADPEPRTGLPGGGDSEPVVVAGPVPPDEEAVRRMVEQTLREERESGVQFPVAAPPAGTTGVAVPATAVGTGRKRRLSFGGRPRVPRQRATWPSRPPLLRSKAAPQALPPDDLDEDLEVVPVKRRKLPRVSSMTMPSMTRPSSSAAGVMLAVVLLLVFGIVAVEMVSSLVSSVTALFD